METRQKCLSSEQRAVIFNFLIALYYYNKGDVLLQCKGQVSLLPFVEDSDFIS